MLSMPRDSCRRRAMLALGIFQACALTARAAETVTVSGVRSTASAPMFIAAGKGYFAAEGLNVEFKRGTLREGGSRPRCAASG
jgi:ABC-type nitrate/sulfonate/bicarbonate transport system substrate-binding protein